MSEVKKWGMFYSGLSMQWSVQTEPILKNCTEDKYIDLVQKSDFDQLQSENKQLRDELLKIYRLSNDTKCPIDEHWGFVYKIRTLARKAVEKVGGSVDKQLTQNGGEDAKS